MRVLHVVGDSAYGGGSRIVTALAEHARAEGHQVSVLTTCVAFQDDLRMRGIECVPLDCIWRPLRPWRDWRGLVRLQAYLNRERYDLVHTHTSKAGFVGRCAAHRARVPIIIHTVHGFAFHEESPRLSKLGYTLLERLASRWCHRIVTVSEHLRGYALALRIGGPDKVLAIPNGIDGPPPATERERDIARARNGILPEEFVVLTAGRLVPAKGLEDLIVALPALRGRSTAAVRLLLAGEGSLERWLRERARAAGVEEGVGFLGYRSDVRELLGAADLVVLPSVREGMSIALLEAMAAGRPIVATRIPPNIEATRDGEAARLVPCGSPAAIAEAIVELIADAPARTRLGSCARRIFEERYTEGRMLARYGELYRALESELLPSTRAGMTSPDRSVLEIPDPGKVAASE